MQQLTRNCASCSPPWQRLLCLRHYHSVRNRSAHHAYSPCGRKTKAAIGSRKLVRLLGPRLAHDATVLHLDDTKVPLVVAAPPHLAVQDVPTGREVVVDEVEQPLDVVVKLLALVPNQRRAILVGHPLAPQPRLRGRRGVGVDHRRVVRVPARLRSLVVEGRAEAVGVVATLHGHVPLAIYAVAVADAGRRRVGAPLHVPRHAEPGEEVAVGFRQRRRDPELALEPGIVAHRVHCWLALASAAALEQGFRSILGALAGWLPAELGRWQACLSALILG